MIESIKSAWIKRTQERLRRKEEDKIFNFIVQHIKNNFDNPSSFIDNYVEIREFKLNDFLLTHSRQPRADLISLKLVNGKELAGWVDQSHAYPGHLGINDLKIDSDLTLKELQYQYYLRMATDGNIAALKKAFDSGFDISYQSRSGKTFLSNAVGSASLNAVKLIIQHGANIDQKFTYLVEDKHYTSLMLASLMGYDDIVKYLIENNANVHATNSKNQTALVITCDHGRIRNIQNEVQPYLNIINALIKAGSDINHEDKDGNTSLLLSSYNIILIKHMLNHGADIERQNHKGISLINKLRSQFSDELEIKNLVLSYVENKKLEEIIENDTILNNSISF